MTARKETLRLPARTPAYVSREVGAAELGISPATWDAWVEAGILPKPAPGFPVSSPRWRWKDVDALLADRKRDGDEAAGPSTVEAIDLGADRAQFLFNGPTARKKHRVT